jgi:hypothetical protein
MQRNRGSGKGLEAGKGYLSIGIVNLLYFSDKKRRFLWHASPGKAKPGETAAQKTNEKRLYCHFKSKMSQELRFQRLEKHTCSPILEQLKLTGVLR